jgi:hypothetical protein
MIARTGVTHKRMAFSLEFTTAGGAWVPGEMRGRRRQKFLRADSVTTGTVLASTAIHAHTLALPRRPLDFPRQSFARTSARIVAERMRGALNRGGEPVARTTTASRPVGKRAA